MRTQIAFRRTLVLLLAAGMGVFLGCSEDGASTAPDNTGTLDTVAPLAPVPNIALIKDGALTVTWIENSEPDVVGYNVYVYDPTPHRVSAYNRLNPAPITTSEYLVSVGATAVEWMRISAVDSSGNESPLSRAFLVRQVTRPVIDGGPEKRHEGGGFE
jgi:hypothetical protein